MTAVRALVLTGYGLNCDYETDYSLKIAGAESHRIHINELIGGEGSRASAALADYHLLVLGGGFSWADDHGAGVLLASKLKFNLADELRRFLDQGKLILGICNGFQTLVNLGLLPGFEGNYKERRAALINNDSGNFIDTWVKLKVNTRSPCVFTQGMNFLDLPVRHGEGKFFASQDDIERLFRQDQVAMQYVDSEGNEASQQWPLNPNGSLGDIAGISDPTGRVFGLMPHPEAFNHYTNHPDWTQKKEILLREGRKMESEEGEGIQVFRNAVQYIQKSLF
jgi:phosphoribosylformylglycinamidine synthase